ncbi:asparagine synthase-related protein [Mesorhizobium prunaredense]|uniref:asparagine synthase-related protein n=1 Tax=Mesorhizobium prunaredense TaxID=1631249 RepID=UPI002452D11D|nr:asparagine synthase-related protein [Mesorhizobium prunaredense]
MLVEAVRKCMVADVEVGSFLSGGSTARSPLRIGGRACRGYGISVVKGSAARASPDRQRVNRAARRNSTVVNALRLGGK